MVKPSGNGGQVVMGLLNVAQCQHGFAWQPLREGVEISYLHDNPLGPYAALLRYAPGASVPRHRHEGFEYIFILQGAQHQDEQEYTAGTLIISPPGSSHGVASTQGCIALAVWEKPVVFLA